MRLCLHCGKIFLGTTTTSRINHTQQCGGDFNQIIEVDENLAAAICLLNQKGYITRNCCSAHIHKKIPFTYVQFQKGIKLPYIPDGFEGTEWNGWPAVEKNHHSCSSSAELQLEILNACSVLLRWAMELPSHLSADKRSRLDDIFADDSRSRMYLASLAAQTPDLVQLDIKQQQIELLKSYFSVSA